jgi:hypothetical protein
MPAAAQGGDDRTAPTRVRSSGPGQDQPPRIDPWAVSIANVLDGDAGEQEPEQFTTLCHGPGRPGSRQVEERLPQNGVGLPSPWRVLGRVIRDRRRSTVLNGICAGQRPYAHHGQRASIMGD